jgi:hypothetical protein
MYTPDLQRLVERERFVEALYSGALAVAREPTVDRRLLLGLACCGCVRPIAVAERLLRQPGYRPDTRPAELALPRDTRLVCEGLEQWVNVLCLDPAARLPTQVRAVADKVLADLVDYARQDFKGFLPPEGAPYTLRQAAWAAVLLLHRLVGMTGTPAGVDTFEAGIGAEVLRSRGLSALLS